MTSLKIVNREIIFYKEKIKEMKHRENIEDNEYYLYIKECLKEQEQIKQDLEILEIIIFLSKNGFDINCLNEDQCKKLNDYLNKLGDSQ